MSARYTSIVLLSTLAYAGAMLLVAGALGVFHPIRALGLTGPKRSQVIAGAGAILIGIACAWPAPLRTRPRVSAIDDVLPRWHFAEYHETTVRAAPERIFSEIWRVTADEIRFFRTLTWIRSPRIRPQPWSVLAPPASRPILDIALAGGFAKTVDLPPRELVLTVRVARDVTAAMNFLVEAGHQGESRVSTETRVHARTPQGLREFRVYWRAIYPGSSLIRYGWLDAIKRRAEAS